MKNIIVACSALALVLLSLSGAALVMAHASSASAPVSAFSLRQVCGTARAGHARCFAIQLEASGQGAVRAAATIAGYGPADLQEAYNLPSATAGKGQTVAVVDAYDDPKAESDLAVYRAHFHQPPCTTANGCFKKVDQNGGTHYPSSYMGDVTGWASELSLDIDMVSAACPNCHILLVEANDDSITNLGKSVNTAVRLGANIVSNSYGYDQSSSDQRIFGAYYNHPGHIIAVASGDDGYHSPAQSPASFSTVVAVGGTSLKRSSNARHWSETAWSSAGSGCSAYISKPAWQKDKGCAKRAEADVSAVGDPITGVAVYDSFGEYPLYWSVFGGTSVATPIIAGVYGLAGNAKSLTYAQSLYTHTSHLYDITSGSTIFCNGTYLCKAGKGYDGPTGLGTPNGVGAF